MNAKVSPLEHLIEILIERGALFLGRAAIVLVVFSMAWVMAGWAQRGVLRACERTQLDPTLVRFLASFVRYGLLILALVSCFGAFGISTTSFAAVVGALGIAVGLALQGTLSNFAAGLTLLLFRPFRVGDTIKAGAHTGTVKALELFSTVLVTADNRRLVLPNSALSNQPLENNTFHPTRRADVLLPFPMEANADLVLPKLIASAHALPNVHEKPAPDAKIQDFNGVTMNILVSAWCDTSDLPALTAALAQASKRVLDDSRVGQLLTPKSPRGDAAAE